MAHQVLGIDFGTSFSSVCVLKQKVRTVVPDELGNTNIPSVVCFGEKEKVGAGADHYKKKYPKNTIYEIKRVVGCRYDDAVVSRLKKVWPFDIVEGADHRVQVEFYVNNKRRRFYPEYVISKILRHLVGLAENATGEKFQNVVITVPANFNDTQRQCIRVAARFAGLQVLRILDEPVAAAVAISIQTNIDNSRVLVYDLGGGTFDFTILEVSVNDYRVIATDGDPCLGGADFTNALTEIAHEKIYRDTSIDSHKNPRLDVELRNNCDFMKQELSSVENAVCEMDLSRYGGPASYMLSISRREFDSVISGYIKRTVDIVSDCLLTYSVDISTVSGIALVGGSSYIPLIRSQLKKAFPTLRILDGYDPREVVCRGALEQAISLVDDPEPVLSSSDSESESEQEPAGRPSEAMDPEPVLSESAPIPFPRPLAPMVPSNSTRSLRSSLTGSGSMVKPKPVFPTNPNAVKPQLVPLPSRPSEPQPELQPEPEPEPQPAPEPAPKKEKLPFRKVRIHPTTPLDLGIRIQGRIMSVIIPRNTPLPAEITKTYQPNADHPDVIRCCMYQGNSHLVDENVKIGIIYAKNIPVHNGVRSVVNITFAINEEGVFSARAKVVGSENPVKIDMLDSVLLTDTMIDSIMEDSKRHEEEEKRREIEEMVSTIEMRLTELEEEDFDTNCDMVEAEREWLYSHKDTATLEDLQKCLDRLNN